VRQWRPGMAPEPIFQNGGGADAPLLEQPGVWLDNLMSARRMQADAGRRDAGTLFGGTPGAGMRPVAHGPAYLRIGTHTLHFGAGALSWAAYATWTQVLARRLGRKLLRCKGVLRMEDGQPWVVQGVQGYFAPPERLPADNRWPGHAFLVCIVDDVEPRLLAAISADVADLPGFSFSPPLPSDDYHG